MQNEETQQASNNPSKLQKALSSLRNCWQKARKDPSALIRSLKTTLNKGVENFFKKSNSIQVFYAALLSLFLFVVIVKCIPLEQTLNNQTVPLPEKILTSNGFWTLITAFISSPVLFVIWRFRDNNATQQINNARKDTNLKEFQKLAEWVSGLHLIDIKNKDNSTALNNELGIGLQISAIYNLLPFYKGDNGDDFRKPSLNLLLSSWSAMQQEDLLSIETDKSAGDRIRDKGNSPLGRALTQTLLAEGGTLFLEFINELPSYCLVGMNFNLDGLEKDKIKNMFKSSSEQGMWLRNIDFSYSNLQGVSFENAKIIESKFIGCLLNNSNFNDCYIERSSFNDFYCDKSTFICSKLNNSSFENSLLSNCDFSSSQMQYCKFNNTRFIKNNFSKSILQANCFDSSHLEHIIFNNANLQGINLSNVSLEKCQFKDSIITNAFLSKDIRQCNFKGSNLCNTNLISSNFLGENNIIQGAFFFENNVELLESLIEKGAIIIATSEKGKRSAIIKFKHRESKDEYVYDNKYTSGFKVDLDKTERLNNKWIIIK